MDPHLKHWENITHNHINLLSLLFPNYNPCDIDFFFVVNEIDTTELLRNPFYNENTMNVVCTNTASAWKSTSVSELGKMNPSRIEEFEDRIRSRGLNPKAIANIRNMEQFHKLSIAIKLKKEAEERMGGRYDKCVRIRPDVVFQTEIFKQMERIYSSDNYLFHLNDLFLIGGSDMFDTMMNILDEVYTINEEIVGDFAPTLEAYQSNRYIHRLFPEVQFMTVVCKHAPTGKYDLSWNIAHPHEWTKYMKIVRFHE